MPICQIGRRSDVGKSIFVRRSSARANLCYKVNIVYQVVNRRNTNKQFVFICRLGNQVVTPESYGKLSVRKQVVYRSCPYIVDNQTNQYIFTIPVSKPSLNSYTGYQSVMAEY